MFANIKRIFHIGEFSRKGGDVQCDLAAIQVDQHSIAYMAARMKTSNVIAGKVVVSILNNQALCALGSDGENHIRILERAISDLKFEPPVTSFDSRRFDLKQGAFVKGGTIYFPHRKADQHHLKVHGSSESFGPLDGLIAGQPITQVISQVLKDQVDRINAGPEALNELRHPI